MPLEITEVLSEYGITAEILADEATTKDTIIEAIAKAQKESLLNNEEFINSIPVEKLPKGVIESIKQEAHKNATGIAGKAVREALGVTDEEYNALSDAERKNLNQSTKALIAKKVALLTGNNDVAEFVKKNAELDAELKDLKTKLETEPQRIRQEIETEYQTKAQKQAFENDILNELIVMSTAGELLGTPKANLQNVLLNHVDAYIWKEVGGVKKAFKKDNEAFPVMIGKEQLTITEAIKNGLKKDGLIKEKIEPTPPVPTPFKVDGKASSYAQNDKLKEKLAADEALKGA